MRSSCSASQGTSLTRCAAFLLLCNLVLCLRITWLQPVISCLWPMTLAMTYCILQCLHCSDGCLWLLVIGATFQCRSQQLQGQTRADLCHTITQQRVLRRNANLWQHGKSGEVQPAPVHKPVQVDAPRIFSPIRSLQNKLLGLLLDRRQPQVAVVVAELLQLCIDQGAQKCVRRKSRRLRAWQYRKK